MYEDRNYVIFNVSEINIINFDEVLETSASTVRLSVDGTKTFVKWNGPSVPASVQALTTKGSYLTHEEILEVLAQSDWTNSEDMI